MASYTPGTYEGAARGYGGKLFVRVTVSEDRIEAVTVTQHKEYRGIAWGLNTTPIERYPELIAAYQSLNIPVVDGADLTVGVFKTDEKEYLANEFCGSFEIVSLTGTVNTMNDEFYCHLHMSAGNDKGEVFGGHLNQAVVSATCEMVITVIDGAVDRYYDEQIGLNLFRF